MGQIANRLLELNIALPTPPAPVASYIPFTRSGALVHISGQVSIAADGGIKGRLGQSLQIESGQAAARLCAINLIAQLNVACDGDLDRLKRVIKLNGFVNVTPDFDAIPMVINGCSNLFVEIFGEAGRHARSAVGVANLPLGFAVEVDGIFEIA